MAGTNYLELIRYWGRYESEDRISYQDLRAGLVPYEGKEMRNANKSYLTLGPSKWQQEPSYARHVDMDQKVSQDESWRNQLKFVIHLVVVANKLV